MFNREDKIKNNQSAFSNGSQEVKSFSTDINSAGKNANTIIGQNISIEGSIRGGENIVLDGHIKGNVELEKHDFIVASKGRFEGEIRAQNMNISGFVMGKVKTKGKVELTKEADFIGDIRSKNFLMEEGAYFKGSIELDREPNKKELLVKKSVSIQAQSSLKDPSQKPE